MVISNELMWHCLPWRRILIRKCRARRHEMERLWGEACEHLSRAEILR